ncbi:gustatory receptor for bitter taste 66a-like isoform X2 [Bactrocera neohumeralis]|uniref:gustatory receptor for bitter taste 66a-like isoform X1 n=1 Tax=Bactrocera neohumeralis TaxID=98809 RepID=UPI002166088C|nr:gustatory receptor for bitter taste 66a-like isoform X1 [Bactrocera neohumeralis]XP_050328904.1 gustatory receptor for bitter taste 66a-like isoform X2 [Bactrocera neohumeralis]
MSEVNGRSQQFLHSFNSIYYLCKLLGVYPYDLQKFYYQGILQPSRLGSCVVVTIMCITFMLFNLSLFTFSDEEVITKNNHLSIIVTIVFTYITPATMFTDQIMALRNQRRLPGLFERIDCVDEDLRQLGITVDNRRVQRGIWLMIAFTFFCEFFIFFSSIWFLVEELKWTTVLWIFISLPTFYNTLDKIWFLGILLGLRDRFDAINAELERIAEELEKRQNQQLKGELYQEHDLVLQTSLPLRQEQIGDIKLEHLVRNAFGESLHEPEPIRNYMLNISHESSLYTFKALQERFISLCQLHDSTCRIAKLLNELWSYPILILMAFGFVVVTSQLYFVYCASQPDHTIPLIFRSAKKRSISTVFLTYIGGKCVSLMLYSWKTSQAARRAGICLHKCGVAADTNEVYEIVNHLSLKLLNHAINFSACGFFTLDMGTLYAVCGAITSYLIILIQFDMAAQQVRISKELAAANETTAIALVTENYTFGMMESTTPWA